MTLDDQSTRGGGSSKDSNRHVHRPARDIFHLSIQFKLKGSDELEEEGFHPATVR
jgi:hypothetical protein